MKSIESIFNEYKKEPNDYLTETLKHLDDNNPNLAKFIIVTAKLQTEDYVQVRIMDAMLLASDIMGLTDPNDLDFIKILPLAEIDSKRLTITELPIKYFTGLLSFIHDHNDNINEIEASENLPKVPFIYVWSKILEIAIAASSSKNIH